MTDEIYEDLCIIGSDSETDSRLDEETFGDVGMLTKEKAQEEYDFVQSSIQFEEEHSQFKHQPSSNNAKKAMTLEELEQQLLSMEQIGSNTSAGNVEIDVEGRLKRWEMRRVYYANLMTNHEKSLMAKIQLKQLSTGNKILDDYYCNQLKVRSTSSSPFSTTQQLPIFVRRPPTKIKKSSISLETALGKASMTSVRVPRKIHRVSREAEFSIKSGASMHLRVLSKIESLYSQLLNIEEIQMKKDELDAEIFTDTLHNLQSEIAQELCIDPQDLSSNRELPCDSVSKNEFLTLIQFLNYPKGQRIIRRLSYYLNDDHLHAMLLKILSCIRYLDVSSLAISVKSSLKINFFINNVILPFVEVIAKQNEEKLIACCSALLGKNFDIHFLSNKICLVILSLLFNELEGQKKGTGQLTQQCTISLFEQIEENCTELFACSAVDEEVDFFAWQFLSFFVQLLNDEKRKFLVVELKGLIVDTASSKNETKIKHLNIFLNSIGLDASQIVS